MNESKAYYSVRRTKLNKLTRIYQYYIQQNTTISFYIWHFNGHNNTKYAISIYNYYPDGVVFIVCRISLCGRCSSFRCWQSRIALLFYRSIRSFNVIISCSDDAVAIYKTKPIIIFSFTHTHTRNSRIQSLCSISMSNTYRSYIVC